MKGVFLSKMFLLSGAISLCNLAGPAARAEPSPVGATLVFEERVTLLPTETVGETPSGLRLRVPITGGSFSGPGIAGKILPGGDDWQVKRTDGSLAIEATYMIETDDGIKIRVHNVGVVRQNEATGAVYRWAAPTFEAPTGKYGWLNDAIFVSTVTPIGGSNPPEVRVTVYRIE